MEIQDPSDFGRAVRSRRRELRLTQEELSFVVGVHRRVIGELERGKLTVQLRIAIDIARALGLNIELTPR
jgi:DNA-binding XRE family transcriptional regulator